RCTCRSSRICHPWRSAGAAPRSSSRRRPPCRWTRSRAARANSSPRPSPCGCSASRTPRRQREGRRRRPHPRHELRRGGSVRVEAPAQRGGQELPSAHPDSPWSRAPGYPRFRTGPDDGGFPVGRNGKAPTRHDRPTAHGGGVRGAPGRGPYRVELVRGRVGRSPRPGVLHGRWGLRLGRLLDEFVEAGGHGVVVVESGTLLERDPDTVRGPDVAFYSHERIPEDAYATTFWGPPDLAVEITSPGNRVSEA